MTYDILKFVFYVLMCLPILVIGFVFYLRLFTNRKTLIEADNKIKAEKAEAKRKARQAELDRQRFMEEYDNNRGYR